MDRLFTFLVLLFFSSLAFARVENLGNLITEGYSEQANSYQQMRMHPRGLQILKTLAKTSGKDRKIKIRLVKKQVMVATGR